MWPIIQFFLSKSNPFPAKVGHINFLSNKGKSPSRKIHKLTQFRECKKAGLGSKLLECSNLIMNILERFLFERKFMWPTFAGNGFDFDKKNWIIGHIWT